MSEMERLAERLREYANLLNDEAGDMAPRNPLKSKLRAEERDLRDAATTLRALTAERDALLKRAEKAEAERKAAINRLCESAREVGDLEARLWANGKPSLIEGWQARAEARSLAAALIQMADMLDRRD